MRARMLVAILLLQATAACSTIQKDYDVNPPFGKHFFRKYDLELAWQAERQGGKIILIGSVVNLRHSHLRDLELTVRLLDEKGYVLARESTIEFPTVITPEQREPFRMTLHFPPGASPARLRFGYTYFLAEHLPTPKGYGGYESNPHTGNLDAPL